MVRQAIYSAEFYLRLLFLTGTVTGGAGLFPCLIAAGAIHFSAGAARAGNLPGFIAFFAGKIAPEVAVFAFSKIPAVVIPVFFSGAAAGSTGLFPFAGTNVAA